MAVHNNWKRYETANSYIQAGINAQYLGEKGIDRSVFVSGYGKRVITFDEVAKKTGAGAWTTQADLAADEANESWHRDNAIFDIRSPYYRDARDDGMFFQAAERLFLPRVYQRLRQDYLRLHTTKLRRMHAEPGSAAGSSSSFCSTLSAARAKPPPRSAVRKFPSMTS